MRTAMLLGWLLGVVAFGALAGPDGIRVGFIDKANSPFVLDPENLDTAQPGITLELLRRVQQRTGVSLDFTPMPWARCLRMLEDGELDAVFHASFDPARQKFGVYPLGDGAADPKRRLITQTYYIYKLKDSPLSWDGIRFSGLDAPLGVVIDFSIKKNLLRLGLEVEEAPDTLTNLRKLKAGRIAAIVNYASQTDSVLARHSAEFADVVKLEPPFKEKIKYLIFSHAFYRENTELAQRIWDELAQIHDSGEYAGIEAAYAAR